MAETRKTHRLMTIEEYLELEKEATERHEFVSGIVHAMTRPTLRHNRIAGNIYAALLAAARGGPCRVYIENAKVRIGDDASYYPDIMVVCGPESDDPYVERNPCLLVERFFRDEEGEWGRAAQFETGSFPVPRPPDARLSLAEVYEGL